MKWNKCSDKLPSKDGAYLVVKNIMGQFQKIDVCYFTKNLRKLDDMYFPKENHPGWYEWDNEAGYYDLTNITHWAELPPLPEGEKK